MVTKNIRRLQFYYKINHLSENKNQLNLFLYLFSKFSNNIYNEPLNFSEQDECDFNSQRLTFYLQFCSLHGFGLFTL